MTTQDTHKEADKAKELPLLAHLDEFRSRLIKCLVALAILFPVTFYVSQPVIEWMKRTLAPDLGKLIYVQPMAYFFVQMKVAFYLALIAAFPYVSYQVWRFVSPALFKEERQYVGIFSMVSATLFLLGAAVSLFFVFPFVMRFSAGMASNEVVPMIDVQGFVGMAGMLMLGFGVMFQMPIIVYLLAKMNIVSVATMAGARPYVYVGIFILAAVLTPGPDVISQLAMAIPTVTLFEGALLFSRFTCQQHDSATTSQE